MPDRPTVSDEQFDRVLARVLQTGVALSAAVVVFGGAMFLWRHAGENPTYHIFRGEPADFRTVSGILAEARSLSGRGFVQLGLLLLIATPVARVVFAVLGFARQRDWLYVATTFVVLCLLLYSLVS